MNTKTTIAVTDDIFNPWDASILRSTGELSEPNDRGLVRIHKSCLDQVKPAPFDSADTSDPMSFCWIPKALVSPATLLYLGFTEVAAQILWARWVLAQLDHQQQQGRASPSPPNPKSRRREGSKGPDSSAAFLDVALAEITAKATPSALSIKDPIADSASSEEHWVHVLDWYGLNAEICRALLNPEFAWARWTSDKMVKEVMTMRFESLKEIQTCSEQRALLFLGK